MSQDLEIVWANPFGLDVAKWGQAEADPIPGLEVTELRTTAPTTMRRWDQYFGPQNRAELAIDYMSPLAGLTDTDYSATLPNGMRVIGTQEQVDKMVAYYGKKSEPEADPLAILAAEYAKACEAETAADWQDMLFRGGYTHQIPATGRVCKDGRLFDEAGERVAGYLAQNDIRDAREVRVTMGDGAVTYFRAQLRSDGTLSWEQAKSEPAQPKRSPNAKPALSGLSIEAPLGNRYGGLGWCDDSL